MNKATGIKRAWRVVLGLAQTSSSFVLLRTVRPGEGKGFAQAHGHRFFCVETLLCTTLLPLRVLGLPQRMGAACSIPFGVVSNMECAVRSVGSASLGLRQGRQALRRPVSSPFHLELPQTLRRAHLFPHPVHIVGDLCVDPIDLLAATFFRASPGH